MLVIVEGSSPARRAEMTVRLADRLKAGVGTGQGLGMPDLEMNLRDYVPGSGENLVLNGWHWGAYVDSRMERREAFQREQLYHVELFLKSRGAMVVHVQPSVEPSGPEGKACKMLQKLSQRSILPALAYTPERGMDELASILDTGLRSLERWVEPTWAVTDRWLGWPDAGVLIVGAKTAPYELLDSGTAYFFRAMEPARLYAAIAPSEAPLHELSDVLGRPRTIALDAYSEGCLWRADVPYVRVPHPSEAWQITDGKPYPYARLLKRASKGRAVALEDLQPKSSDEEDSDE